MSLPSPLFPLFGISDKKHMVGSPKRKKNYGISPKKNKEAKRYKASRERDRKNKDKKQI